MIQRLKYEQVFTQVLNTAPDAMLLADQDSMLVHVNSMLCKMFGYTESELLGKPIDCLLPDRYRNTHKQQVRGYFDQLHVRPMGIGKTLYALRKDGQEFPVEISLSPMESDEVTFVVAAIRDVSDRIRVQNMLEAYNLELLQSNQDLEQFAYVASHDLQEPLRIITSFTQLLEKRYKDRLDAEGVEFIEYIVDAARRMKQLINDLLTYSKVHQQHHRHTEVNLNDVLQSVQNNLLTSIDDSGASIEIGNLPSIYGDPAQIIQLFQNLISNAIKFRQEGVPPVVLVYSAGKKNDYEVISVEDRGIGIKQEYQDRIFSLFQRLHTAEEYDGTGIGLAICKRIVDRHMGKIEVDSIYGKGTRFDVYLKGC